MKTDILIVGGGLSGLSIADQLEAAGAEYLLVEAADQLGGRILSETIMGATFDLGPAWFWPYQPRIAGLIKRFGLQRFDQYSKGAIVYQDKTGTVHRNRGYASMQGSYRVSGGMSALIDGLRSGLTDHRVRLNSPIKSITWTSDGIEASLETSASAVVFAANKVVLAIPPRVVGENIQFAPPLPEAATTALQNIPTWMAGQAKILAVYDRPYWREAGLSGNGMSQKGPMVEIHDASPMQGGPYALFGFVGFPPSMRQQHPQAILDLARDQLVAMFGEEMENPIEIKLLDWAQNPLIATYKDHTSPQFHTTYGMPREINNLWGGDLLIVSTEMAQQFGGFLEGALEAAEMTVLQLRKPIKALA